MKICRHCAAQNREGSLFCEDCGRPLSGSSSIMPTKQFERATDELGGRNSWGTAQFRGEAHVVLHFRDTSEPITLNIDGRKLFGRMDNTDKQKPDLDLTPYGALEKGVSRIHAAIARNDETLTLIDMGSSNGTHLNGQRLVPNQPRVLRDGDEIRFGKLVAHIYFKMGPMPN